MNHTIQKFRRGAALAGLVLCLAAGGFAAQKNNDKETETRTVQGQVAFKNGATIEKAIVHLKNTRTLQLRTYISDADGSYKFHGLSFNVDYQIHAEHEGATSNVRTVSSFDTRKDVHMSLIIDKK